MSNLAILLIGMAIVIGGVLVLRLHAFLALMAGALAVGVLTPRSHLYRFALRGLTVDVQPAGPGQAFLSVKGAVVGTSYLLVRAPHGNASVLVGSATTRGLQDGVINGITSFTVPHNGYASIATLRVTGPDIDGRAPAQIVPLPSGIPAGVSADVASRLAASARIVPDIQPGDFAVPAAANVAANRAAELPIGQRMSTALGDTAVKVGIVIAMAAIIGETMLLSGAAERIVLAGHRMLGDKQVGIAFLASGFILGIPVFFDTVFYLLVPLAKAMRIRTGRSYLLYVLGIIAGGTITFALVPPAPGPLFVAQQFGVGLATMMGRGLLLGALAAGAGYAYALWANHRWEIPLRPSGGATRDSYIERDPATLPPLWLSILPIALPIVLISIVAVDTAATKGASMPDWIRTGASWFRSIGEQNAALMISAAIALLTAGLYRQGSHAEKPLSGSVAAALASAGVIILICTSGGVFGQMLQQTDIAATLQSTLPSSKLALLPLAFGVTSIVRAAQGSATVAMITASGMFAPIALAGGLPYHPVYIALAIGCGAKMFLWMNDSGFWVMSRMSGMTEPETLKTATVMMSIMGTVGLAGAMVGAMVWPGI